MSLQMRNEKCQLISRTIRKCEDVDVVCVDVLAGLLARAVFENINEVSEWKKIVES